MTKVAVVLFNLGGPLNKEAVRPFLFNLFHDKAILGLPQPFRYLLAQLISRRRKAIAQEIYAKLNGGSPILKKTCDQADALSQRLAEIDRETTYKIFIAMRYWHPFAKETVGEVKAYAPDQIILLPLYPQFSTTTTGSSLSNWTHTAARVGLNAPTRAICCYPDQPGFIRALAERTRRAYHEACTYGTPRILFSAHGLPEKIIKAGDPYQAQCQMTVDALRETLALGDELDSVLCFQSRVGPLKWITPATDAEVCRAGRDKVPLVVVPVAFVSDHSETLVELDIEYRHLATQHGVPHYTVVPAVGIAPDFIQGLADVTLKARGQKSHCLSSTGSRICASQFTGCPFDAAFETEAARAL